MIAAVSAAMIAAGSRPAGAAGGSRARYRAGRSQGRIGSTPNRSDAAGSINEDGGCHQCHQRGQQAIFGKILSALVSAK